MIKKITRNKRAISLMLSYVLLVVIGLSLSIGVYSWLKFVVKGQESIEKCPEGVSLILKDYKILADKKIELTIKNKGFFNISGYYIKGTSNKSQEAWFKLKDIMASSISGAVEGTYLFSKPFSPGDENTHTFSYEGLDKLEKIEIEPFRIQESKVFKKKKIILCEEAVIRQEIEEIPAGTFVPVHCGNGYREIEEGESCDGSELGGETCVSQGFDLGTLACTTSCTFDVSGCLDMLQLSGLVSYWKFDDDQYDDDFDSLNESKWGKEQTNGKVEVINNYLNATCQAGSGCVAGIWTKEKITGDFDVQIDFTLINFPATTEGYAELLVGGNPGNWSRIEIQRDASSKKYRVDSYQSNEAQSGATADNSGKLRINRTGNTFTFYYWSGSSWTQLHSENYANFGNEVYIEPRSETGGSYPAIEVHFDNFIINNGEKASDSKDGNIGAINGASWINRQSGNALSFDGVDDYVDVGNNPSIVITGANPRTVSAWIYYTGNAGDIIGWGGDANGQRFALKVQTGKLFAWGYGGVYDFYGNTPLTQNTWYHVVLTYDGTTRILYLNGTNDGSNTASLNTSNTYGVEIGRQSGGGNYFNGTIDEVMIFNESLSQEDIIFLYNYYTS